MATTSVLNTSGITTGPDGRLRVSGLSSSIDWRSIVDAQMTARRAPAVRLETRITENTTLANAYTELKTKTSAISTALNKLRNAPGSSQNVFNTKTATGSTAAATGAPPTHVPSSINSLLLTSISNTAQSGTYNIKIQQTALAQQIRADAQTSTTASLSSLGIPTGSFVLNGKTINVSSTDTLQDLRAAINASDAGVNASIISADATTNYLVLTSSETGTANTMTFTGSNDIPAALGLTTALQVPKNELTTARDSIIDVNGVTGITRSSNTISDVVNGVTLSLIKSEPDTEITIEVAPDLNTIKTAIAEFVTAYNDMRAFNTEQRTAADRNDDGTIEDNELGPLAYDQRMRDIVSRLGLLASTSISGNTDGYRSLAQIGITLDSDYTLSVDDATLDSKLLENVDAVQSLFGLTTSSSDSRLTVLTRTADTQSGTYYLNLSGTDGSGQLLSGNIRTTAGTGTGGADDGSVTVAGQIATVATGDATGLQAFFNGGNSLGAVNDIEITIQRGVADLFYDYFNEQSRNGIGALDTAITELTEQNIDYNDRIDVIDERLVFVRANLEARFVRMETALATLENLRSTIQSYVDGLSQN